MTHDELLAKIEREEDYLKTYAEGYGFVVTDALRAVVELCKEAQYDIDVSGFAETIMETIEKELG